MIARGFNSLGGVLLTVCALCAPAGAFASPPADVTIQVVDSEEYAEESLVSEIKLPDIASLKAHKNAADGLETATQAHTNPPGLETANEVRRLGQDLGREQSAEARELGREARHGNPTLPGRPPVPDRPDTPAPPEKPDVPERPDIPGKPDVPGKPGVPGKPNVPGRPDTPANPGVPDIPGNPGVPGGNNVSGKPNIP
jgi:hypothetical protein